MKRLVKEGPKQRKEKEKEKRTLNRVSKQTADLRGKHCNKQHIAVQHFDIPRLSYLLLSNIGFQN